MPCSSLSLSLRCFALQFGTSVERVHPTKKAEVTIWEITTRKVDQNKFEHWEFDMVMICNGYVLW